MILNQLGSAYYRGSLSRGTSTVPRAFDDELVAGVLYLVAAMICKVFADTFSHLLIERESLPVQAEEGRVNTKCRGPLRRERVVLA